MNYEAKSKKGNQPLKTSIWWTTTGGSAWAENGIVISLFIISVLVLSLQWVFRSDMNEYVREYHTKVESEWKIVNKLAENEKKSSTYYLYLKNSKYNWVKKVDAQTYLMYDIGSTIKIKYDKAELLGESGVNWEVNLVILITVLTMIVFMVSTIFTVNTVLLIDPVYLTDFKYTVQKNNQREFNDTDFYDIEKIYNRYVKTLKAVNTFTIVYFICFTAFMVKQVIFYIG